MNVSLNSTQFRGNMSQQVNCDGQKKDKFQVLTVDDQFILFAPAAVSAVPIMNT